MLWNNDVLMALLCFLVCLERKREILAGKLLEPSRAVLPVIGWVQWRFLLQLILFSFGCVAVTRLSCALDIEAIFNELGGH